MDSRKKTLTNLIFIICISIIGFTGVNFISCNFLVPGSINNANVNGNLKNPPPLDCKESERRGYEVVLTVLTTIIALKTRMEDGE
jgi:lipopolysaccharide export LptBFGC system permease protein LptF